MEGNGIRLSVEELALTVSMAGQPDVAHGLMVAQLGDMDQSEARARLMTAGHSLIARGWATITEQGNITLEDPLSEIAPVLSRADFSVRYGRSYPAADLTLAFHFKGKDILAQRVEQGVVHHIAQARDVADVVQSGMVFFDVGQGDSVASSSSEIPYNVLEAVKGVDHKETIIGELRDADVPERTATLLAEDLTEAQYRGSVLRIEYDENNSPRSDKGLLVLRGPERLWLFPVFRHNERGSVALLPGTKEAFQQQVSALIKPEEA